AAAALKIVQPLRDYPTAANDVEVKRPYRIWDSVAKKQVTYLYFVNLRHAHMRALCEAAWSHSETVFEIFDIRNGGLRGQYQRVGQQIKFWRSSHSLEDQ